MNATQDTLKAIGRLLQNTDFVLFMRWVEAERDKEIEALLTAGSAITVHQLQGSSRALSDIARAVKAATPALAR